MSNARTMAMANNPHAARRVQAAAEVAASAMAGPSRPVPDRRQRRAGELSPTRFTAPVSRAERAHASSRVNIELIIALSKSGVRRVPSFAVNDDRTSTGPTHRPPGRATGASDGDTSPLIDRKNLATKNGRSLKSAMRQAFSTCRMAPVALSATARSLLPVEPRPQLPHARHQCVRARDEPHLPPPPLSRGAAQMGGIHSE
jgi:hypothetical protein